MLSSSGGLMRFFRTRLRLIHFAILAVMCISFTWVISTLWIPDYKNPAILEPELRANILRLSLDYVRLLARAQENTVDGPYQSVNTNYDMKKTLAVLLNNMNLRIEQLDAEVKQLRARLPAVRTEAGSQVGLGTQRRLHEVHEANSSETDGMVNFAALLRGVQEGCVVDARKMLSYPECQSKMEWLRTRWQSVRCYAEHGVDGSDCSLVRYLSEIENFCPLIEGRTNYLNRPFAQVTYDLNSLLSRLLPEEKHSNSFQFIRSRLIRMWPQWIDGMKRYASWNGADETAILGSQSVDSLPPVTGSTCQKARPPFGQPHFFNRTQLNVHLYLSFMSFSSSAHFERSIDKGGPLGELVQWTDLLAALHILGHRVSVSIETPVLFKFLNFVPTRKSECQTEQNVFDLLFTDIVGYRRLTTLGVRIPKCKYRILDSFGTEAFFNKEKKNTSWGGLQMNLKQFYTMFPHSPDNTFLGFTVEKMTNNRSYTSKFDSNSIASDIVRSKSDKPIALVYGKEAYMWKNALPYLLVLNESFELHGNVLDAALDHRFAFVVQHNCSYGEKFAALMRSAKVFVGLGFPYEGPAPLEAIANGVIFLNPHFTTPHWRNNIKFFSDKPTSRKLTSQHPYLEQYVGEPYAYMIQMDNPDEIRRTVRRLLAQPKINPYVPFEFTATGYLERLNALLNRQSFCTGPERLALLRTPWQLDSDGAAKEYLDLNANVVQWPPLGPGGVQLLIGAEGKSCADTCAAAAATPQTESIKANSSYLHLRAQYIHDLPKSNNFSHPSMYCAPEHFTSTNHYTLMESLLEGSYCARIQSKPNTAAPYWDPQERLCVLQADRLLFDCTAKPAGTRSRRLCPCRTVLPGQVALCTNCV